ncbi:MAG: hypothetical protein Q9207_000325 [Kuettlingeria erythrocarpa]
MSPSRNGWPSQHSIKTEKLERGQRSSNTGTKSQQRALKLMHVDSLLLALAPVDGTSSEKGLLSGNNVRSSPRKAAALHDSDSSDHENASSDHMSDFIVPDSESDDSSGELASQSPVSPANFQRRPLSFTRSPARFFSLKGGQVRHSGRSPDLPSKGDPGTGGTKGKRLKERRFVGEGTLPVHAVGFQDPQSMLKLLGPTSSPPVDRAVTPASSPRKSKLLSPTKRVHVPQLPHRPSMDAFWSQEVINDWNDQHSPKKTPTSARTRLRHALGDDEDDELSLCESGCLSPAGSPTKSNKEAAEKRNAFNERKYEMAASFLKELDETIVNGQIAILAEPTGGVRLVWSKKLQSTAGRANWRREAIRCKDADGTVTTTEFRHHASIELAEKVIDNESRLINVIAHEYCHLLNFMISNVKDRPHGKEFKAWARTCSAAFAHRGVDVTTKHSYEISYKYVWACTDCGTEYKRHSRSIDPARHSCGKCKEKLVQVKPVPRGEGKGISEYQRFVKERFRVVKKQRPELGMGEIMAVLGKEFKDIKMKKQMVVIVEPQSVEERKGGEQQEGQFDSVVMKLDSLDLGSREG